MATDDPRHCVSGYFIGVPSSAIKPIFEDFGPLTSYTSFELDPDHTYHFARVEYLNERDAIAAYEATKDGKLLHRDTIVNVEWA